MTTQQRAWAPLDKLSPVAANSSAATRAARAGAAAFAVGLFMAGPQAVGIAAAETDSGGDTASASAAGDRTGGTARAAKAPTARPGNTGKPRPPRTPAAAASARAPRAAATITPPTSRSGSPDRPTRARTAPVRTQPVLPTPSAALSAPASGGDIQAPAAALSPTATTAPAQPGADTVAAAPPAGTSARAIAPIALAPARIDGVNTRANKLLGALADLVATLPNQKLSDLLAGALLLVRRNLLDQAPTASPVQETITPAGQILGTLGAIDPEDDPLTYAVTINPEFGTVELNPDGHYVYTPADDFTGTDSFTVKITETNAGFNVLEPRADRATEVTVAVGTQGATDPFDAGNRHDATIFLGDTSALITVDRKAGRLIGSVALTIPDDTSLTWLDEHGRTGVMSAADVAAHWDDIQSAGSVRLGVDYTLEDTDYTVILTSVEATYTEDGQYLFSGTLAPDVHDGKGVDSFWDVIGNSYKSNYQNFLQQNVHGKGNKIQGPGSFTLDVANASVHLDTFGVSDYESELEGSDPGMSAAEFFAASAQSAQSQLVANATTAGLSQAVLKQAVAFANSGGRALSTQDPVFLQTAYQPICNATNSCDGSFYYVNISQAPTKLAQTSIPLGTNDATQSVDLSFDLGESAYGYLYVPGLWDLLNPAKYSVGALLAVTAGPSFTVNLGSGANGTFNYGPVKLQTSGVLKEGEYGKIELKADVTSNLDAKLDLPDGFTGSKATGSAYLTGGLLLGYNTTGGRWAGEWNYAFDPNVTNFTQGTSIKPTVSPTVTGALRLSTPKSTPIIGAVTLGEVSVVYSNPVTVDLSLSASPSLTIESTGNLRYNAGFLTNITNSLKFNGTYDYTATTGNLLSQ